MASPPEARVSEVSFLEFRDRAGLDRRRVPIEGTIETTYRCNLDCVHCYVNQPAGSGEERDRELSFDRLKGLVDEIVAEGTLFVLFTGGEVLIRPDFPELYLYARSKGLLVTIFTNGTLVTDRIADLFAEHRPDKVEVSLYGMTRETYERVARVPGSFERCLAGIRRLVERRVPVTLKTMALTWNHHEVEAMEAYAKGLGLDFRFDSSLNPRVDCGANRNAELQLEPERALALDLGSPERMEGFREFCERFTRPDAEYGAEKVYTCGAGQSSFTVDPYGRLQMCQLSRKSFHDLRGGRFADGWHGLFPKLRERTWQTNEVCRKCSLMALCGSCPGAAEMETGDVGERARSLAGARGVAVEVEAPEVGTALVDPGQLRQAIDNLVRNAVEATPEGGRVSLFARREDGGHVVEVRDTGRGIEPDHLPRVFDLYFTTKADGTGVGLAVTQQIVTAHGGTIEVDSRPGAGTIMTVRLPAGGEATGG